MRKSFPYLKFFCKISIAAILCVCSIAGVQAQTSNTLKDKPVTLRVSNQPLGKVLEMVAESVNAKIIFQEVYFEK